MRVWHRDRSSASESRTRCGATRCGAEHERKLDSARILALDVAALLVHAMRSVLWPVFAVTAIAAVPVSRGRRSGWPGSMGVRAPVWPACFDGPVGELWIETDPPWTDPRRPADRAATCARTLAPRRVTALHQRGRAGARRVDGCRRELRLPRRCFANRRAHSRAGQGRRDAAAATRVPCRRPRLTPRGCSPEHARWGGIRRAAKRERET